MAHVRLADYRTDQVTQSLLLAAMGSCLDSSVSLSAAYRTMVAIALCEAAGCH